MPSDAGQRNRHVTLETLSTETAGSDSFPVETWTTLPGNWWASKRDLRGRERLVNGQNASAFEVVWGFEYAAAIDPELVDVQKTLRIVYQGRTYDIVGAAMLGLRQGIELMTLASGRVA